MSTIKALCIDLDGTLIDTASEITAGLNDALIALKHKPLSLEQAKKAIGLGGLHLVRQALGVQSTKQEFDLIHEQFQLHYKKHLMTSSKVYEGVFATLEALKQKGLICSVVTNKSRAFAMPLLEGHDLSGHFKVITCGDDYPTRKPDTRSTLETIKAMGDFKASEVLFVGDSITDYTTALHAKMPFVGVRYGYNGDKPLEVHPPAVLIDNFEQIIALVAKS